MLGDVIVILTADRAFIDLQPVEWRTTRRFSLRQRIERNRGRQSGALDAANGGSRDADLMGTALYGCRPA